MTRNRTYAEEKRRKATVQVWIAANGYSCPGWGVPPHPSRDLTADHVVPRYWGGEAGLLRVLCRGCNTRRRYVA
jgi:5-methylcytosine-specific restriction protein A